MLRFSSLIINMWVRMLDNLSINGRTTTACTSNRNVGLQENILHSSWTDQVTNEEILIQIGTTRTRIKSIGKRQLSFLGHVMRKELENIVLTGKIEGKGAKGRQRMKYLDNVKRYGQTLGQRKQYKECTTERCGMT